MSLDTINRIISDWGKNVEKKDGVEKYRSYYMDTNKSFVNAEPNMGTFIKLFIEPDNATKTGNSSNGVDKCFVETGVIIAQCFTDEGLGKLTLWEIIDRITEVYLDNKLPPSNEEEKGTFYFSDVEPRAVGTVPKLSQSGATNQENWFRHDVFILYRKDF